MLHRLIFSLFLLILIFFKPPETTFALSITILNDAKPIIHNNEWAPVIKKFDSIEMVFVPPGCFLMGATNEQISNTFNTCEGESCPFLPFEASQPIHKICFEQAFWIDRFEVSNAQFASLSDMYFSNQSQWTEDNHPRENVSWLEANHFCQLRGMRLPTEAEWEYAARGPDSLIFPWGNIFIPSDTTYRDNSNQQTVPIGSNHKDVSWVGAYDMSGNVSEWTNTISDPINFPYPYHSQDGREDMSDALRWHRVIRGGSWQSNMPMLSTWFRTSNNAIDSSSTWGFRCAKSEG